MVTGNFYYLKDSYYVFIMIGYQDYPYRFGHNPQELVVMVLNTMMTF